MGITMNVTKLQLNGNTRHNKNDIVREKWWGGVKAKQNKREKLNSHWGVKDGTRVR